MDVNEIKKDFPIFNRKMKNGKHLVYLDSAATSQKPDRVIESMNHFYRNSNANIHRGIHELAEEATHLYESARADIADFIGVTNSKEIIFTRNTTEAINLVAFSWGRRFLNPGDLILLTEMEHHSNIVPWFILAEEKKITIQFIRVLESGVLDFEHYISLLGKHPKLVAFTHMSNVLGTINPTKKMVELAHQAGAISLVDGAQSVPHIPVNVDDLDADFYAFSAHKMLGPTGIGVLFAKLLLLESMPPFLGGGDMIKKVTFDGFSANTIPYKFEAGTPAIAEGIGFGAAVNYLKFIGMQAIEAHEKELTAYALNCLDDIEDLHIIGPGVEHKGGVISFYIDGIHPHDIAQILDTRGIAVRAGHHCAMPLHSRYHIPASTRASVYLYNSKEDIDALKAGLLKVKEIFK